MVRASEFVRCFFMEHRMEIIKLLQLLDVGELSLGVVVILTLIQIAPIKVNPWSWIARKIGGAINVDLTKKVDDLEKKIDELDSKIDEVDKKGDEREAINHRVRILRFADELLENREHSKDSFDQVMSDITAYNKYCADHPKFQNEQTVATVAYIRKAYDTRFEKKDFA